MVFVLFEFGCIFVLISEEEEKVASNETFHWYTLLEQCQIERMDPLDGLVPATSFYVVCQIGFGLCLSRRCSP